MPRLAVVFVISCLGFAIADKAIVQLPSDKVAQILQGAMLCIGETGVSPEVLIQYRSGKTLAEDKNFQKFINCVFLKNGYADKTGHIKIEKAMEVFPKNADKEAIKKIMEECNKETGVDPAEVSFKFVKCFRQKAPVKIVI